MMKKVKPNANAIVISKTSTIPFPTAKTNEINTSVKKFIIENNGFNIHVREAYLQKHACFT